MSNLTEESYPLLNLQENGLERSQTEQQTQINQPHIQPEGQPMRQLMVAPTQMAPSGTVQHGGFVHCPPIGAVPYQPAMVPVVMQPMTNEIAPNDYLVMTIILTAICAFFNLLSLVFGIPAVVCAALAYYNKNQRNYTSTRSLGISAVILSTLNVVYTLVISLVIIGYSMYVLGAITAWD